MKLSLVLIFLGVVLVSFSTITFFFSSIGTREVISPLADQLKTELPLEKYSFESLQRRFFLGNQINLERTLKDDDKFTSYLFSYHSQGKKITGMADIPKGGPPAGGFPVIVMVRGYVDDKIYRTGVGTEKPAEFFAKNGFITLAPDFLGFGESDATYADILEDRFVRPVNILDLFASIRTLKQADPGKVALWGHSNGGQIAISVLEISRQSTPTVLWAPVTQGFPESVTTYMGQLDDLGVKVKERIDDFVEVYDQGKFSITNYFSYIKAPLEVHQGTGDEYIEKAWTDKFVNKMKTLGKLVTYYTYKGDDHNLRSNWNVVVARDLEFFKRNLKLE